jgi:hypothetical protein
MTESEELKRLWQEEAQQLKDDLKKRPKEIKFREKEIRVGKPSSKKMSTINKATSQPSNKQNDDFLRQQLGI